MRFWSFLLWLALVGPALAQVVPVENPNEVWVKGRLVDHSWREGRIWVPSGELAPLLNLKSDLPSTDLLRALEEKGGYLWSVENGVFRASPDPSLYSTASTAQRSQANRIAVPPRSGFDGKRSKNQLTASVQKFVAEETGYVRAWVVVTNSGTQVNDPSQMVVEFQDNFHYAWAKDEKSIPGLHPGESLVFECFSMVPDEVKSVDGVQRTMNGDQVVCKFRSMTNPDNDDQDQVRKEERRGRKIEFHAPKTSPLKTSPLPTFSIGR